MMKLLNVFAAVCFVSLSVVSAAASPQHRLGVLQPFVTLPTGLGGEGLVIHNGAFYVSTISFSAADGTIFIFDHRGNMIQKITVPGLPEVGELAFATDGTLYAVAGNLNTRTDSMVIRVNLGSETVKSVASGFEFANGLVIGPDGDFYVADPLASAVYKVTPAGDVSTFASGPLLAAAVVPQVGLSLGTNDLAFNRDGTALFVTDTGLGTVVRIGVNADGTAGSIANFASVPTPDGIALDIKGNLYVTSVFTNTIQVIGKDGSVHALSLDTTDISLNNPTNVAFIGRRMFITNLAFSGASVIESTVVQFPGLPLTG